MALPRGIQSEVLLSLAFLVATAIGLLAGFLVRAQASQQQQLEGLLGRALVAEAPLALLEVERSASGARWHRYVDPARRAGPGPAPDDEPAGLEHLVAESRRLRKPLLASGQPWDPMLFAAPLDASGDIAAGWFPPVVSGMAIIGLVVADIAVFVGLGAYLLRRRVTGPLARLAAATHELGEGDRAVRAPVEGVQEVADLAADFNSMGEALEQRTEALEKAVSDLRTANRDLRQARAGLDRAERLAAVGTLAAGVAHEVGNPMGAVLAFLDLARREGERDGLGEHGLSLLGKAAREGDRVRGILRQLLDFSRPAQSQLAPVSLQGAAEQALELVQAQRRYAGIEYALHCDEQLPLVMADQGLVAQVLLNLLLNASDAVCSDDVRDTARVEITVRPAVSERRAGDSPQDNEAALERCDSVECEVADDGPGISAEDRPRIFDPFYTTKAPGEGTGLGLANALRLTEELGGSLECIAAEDAPLGGACFRMRLPIHEPDGRAADPSSGSRTREACTEASGD